MSNTFKKGSSDGIQEAHEQWMATATKDAKAAGLRGNPKEGEPLDAYIKHIVGGYNQLIAQYVTPHIASSSRKYAELQQTSMQERTERAKRTLAELLEKLRKATLQKEELPKDGDANLYLGIHALIWLCALMESIISARAFNFFSHGTNLFALFIMLGLTIVFAMLPKAVVWFIRFTEDKPYKWPVRIGIGVILVVGIGVIGIMRQGYVDSYASTTLDAVKPIGSTLKWWHYSILQLFFMVISIYLAMQIPDKVQRSNGKRLKQAEQTVRDLEERIQEEEERLNRMPESAASAETARHQSMAQAKAASARIVGLYHQCVGHYKQVNATWRPGDAPACFSEPVPDLDIPHIES